MHRTALLLGPKKRSPRRALQPFHLAIPVHSIPAARAFYGGLLGCEEGRRDGDVWQDYSLFGHQLVCHFVSRKYRGHDHYNDVDKHGVPVPHFGLCLTVPQFRALARRLTQQCGADNGAKEPQHRVKFIIPPYLRFKGAPGEQWTMFFKDPSGNNLEFKAMTSPRNLFAKYDVARRK